MAGELSLLLTYQGWEKLSNVPAVWFTKASTETPPFSLLFCYDDIQLKTFTGHHFLHSHVQYYVKKQLPLSASTSSSQTNYYLQLSVPIPFFPSSLALAMGCPSQGYPKRRELLMRGGKLSREMQQHKQDRQVGLHVVPHAPPSLGVRVRLMPKEPSFPALLPGLPLSFDMGRHFPVLLTVDSQNNIKVITEHLIRSLTEEGRCTCWFLALQCWTATIDAPNIIR